MAARIPDSLDRLSHDDLIGVVRDLIQEVTRLRSENEKLSVALGKLRVEHQAVKDELARLKHLPPRPPIKPSGMDKATDAKGPEGRGRRERRALDAAARQPTRQADDRRDGGGEGEGAGGLAPQGLRRHRGSGLEPEADGDALSARAVGNARRRDDRRQSRFRHCRGLWPQPESLGLGAALCRTNDLRADRRAAQWDGRGDFEATGGSPADGQAGEVPGGGCGGVEGGLERRLCHGRRYGGAPRRQERLHHADRLFQLHRVSHRALQVASGVSVAALRRNVALGDQRGRARLYERARSVADRDRQVHRA